MKLLANSAQIVTVNTDGKNIKRGEDLHDLGVLTEHAIIIENDRIKDIIPNSSIKNTSRYDIIDLHETTILPGLVECHTHTAHVGSRADEFKMKLQGSTYEEIAIKGGGILSTVKAVRNSSMNDLVKLLVPRVKYFISQGITTLEIKSGYGLDLENEIKLLEAINKLKTFFSIDIIPTFLGAHTYPSEFKENHSGYLKLITEKMLPLIAEKKLARFCDAFCEDTAFSADEVDLIFTKAKELGFPLRLHTEQFNNIGGVELALFHEAVSVDHLEVMTEKQIFKLAAFDTVAVLLPGVSFFLDYQYAPARKLIENNAIVALSTDYNPGSSHIPNLNLIMSIAAIKMKMSFEEIIPAVTINAAKALLKNHEIGSIEIGKKADFAVFNTKNYPDIIYNVGKNLNIITIKNGKIIYQANDL
ncbi:MAG: imidazolonepropionase [Ignavibacteriaceae bacterium]|nr:imidazolonepropionase [Ignavibacteriaceae bacterium]